MEMACQEEKRVVKLVVWRPLRFRSFSAKDCLRAWRRVKLRASHSAVLVANRVYCCVVSRPVWREPEGRGAGWKGSAAAAAACSAAVCASCLRAICSTVVGR